MSLPTNNSQPDKQSGRRNDDSTARLHAHNAPSLALHKEGKRLAREQRRKEWYAKNGGVK